jgi:hypothetical protein
LSNISERGQSAAQAAQHPKIKLDKHQNIDEDSVVHHMFVLVDNHKLCIKSENDAGPCHRIHNSKARAMCPPGIKCYIGGCQTINAECKLPSCMSSQRGRLECKCRQSEREPMRGRAASISRPENASDRSTNAGPMRRAKKPTN